MWHNLSSMYSFLQCTSCVLVILTSSAPLVIQYLWVQLKLWGRIQAITLSVNFIRTLSCCMFMNAYRRLSGCSAKAVMKSISMTITLICRAKQFPYLLALKFEERVRFRAESVKVDSKTTYAISDQHRFLYIVGYVETITPCAKFVLHRISGARSVGAWIKPVSSPTLLRKRPNWFSQFWRQTSRSMPRKCS